ncbi:hypothetical protein PsorP6_001848 [Peronosclerospora sorghi]|uniref:Uncharacterized protein n=1 Tax=Peronosclerospora sorghi TaxID=230839 RepID=A0ACC0WRZ9_9STRA|nr:hypothetical protein PsorP6_001848 [Peronosclerospora sorghi]
MDWDPMATETDGYICPPCPVFHPTPEEFLHPLKYISSIRHIGMQAGICKIVPPKGWRPPFAINENTFRFRTRVQQLNCIEGHSRAEGQFVEALRLFLYQQGEPMKDFPRADGQLVNLHALYKTVRALGGFDAVCANKLWPLVVRRVGRTKAAADPSDTLCRVYQSHYKSTLLAYEMAQCRKETKSDGPRDSDTPNGNKSDGPRDSDTANGNKSDGPRDSDTPNGNKSDGRRDAHASVRDTRATRATPSSTLSASGTRATPPSKPRSLRASTPPSSERDRSTNVKRTLFADSSDEHDSPASPNNLEPAALQPSATRQTRLEAPPLHVGQKFYRYVPDTGAAVVAQIKRVVRGKKPHVTIQYVDDGTHDDVELSTVELLVANGWDAAAAEVAYTSAICQACLRGDCADKMLLCDGCNSGQHLFCLETPLAHVPTGDWYCPECVDEATASDPFERTHAARFGFAMGAEVSLREFKHHADAWKRQYFDLAGTTDPDDAIPEEQVERAYWQLVSQPVHEQRVEVQYGSDVDTGASGSGFPRVDLQRKNRRTVLNRWKTLHGEPLRTSPTLSAFFAHGLCPDTVKDATDARVVDQVLARYAHDDWNLNNLPKVPGSVLQHLDEDIQGVMVPWLYAGMCFSTFCWHVEDHNFYSTSYLHCGASKTWYGIPSASAAHFERTIQSLTPELFGTQPDLHMQLVTMFSPAVLRQHGVPVYRATHRPNEFIVTFPSAYHAGFNTGFNCAEAVNFATMDWLPWGAQSLHKYREFHKLPVFCHEALVWTLAETLVEDGSSFDVDETEAALVPAIEQLVRDFCAFQARVDDATSPMRVLKREQMAEYSHEVGKSHGMDMTTSMRRHLASRACKRASKMEATTRGGRIKRQSKMETQARGGGMRPRMVLWAGRSGKNQGLRCLVCKQYCYLQAVVCVRCHSTDAIVGCVDHYPTMCKCRNALNFLYLYRHPLARLEALVDKIHTRVQTVRTWQRECDEMLHAATRSSIRAAQRLISRGKASGGADVERLDALEGAVASAQAWDSRAQTLLTAFTHDKTTALALADADTLFTEAQTLLVVPEALETLETVVNEWHAARKEATTLLTLVKEIGRAESGSPKTRQSPSTDAAVLVESVGTPSTLLERTEQYTELKTALETVNERLRAKESEDAGSLRSQVRRAQHYLDTLCRVNTVAARLVTRAHSPRTTDAVFIDDVEPVLEQVDGSDVATCHGSATAETLRKLVAMAHVHAREVDDALRDRSKSTEELQVVLRRVEAMPLWPRCALELETRLTRSRAWETHAMALLARDKERPALEHVETFYHQADAHFVPSSSLLRRQLHARVQDCRRWYDTVHALFVRPSTGHLSLAQFLTSALERAHHVAQCPEHHVRLHAQLHCVCDQILSEKATVRTCRGCQRYFHPQCLPTASSPVDDFRCLRCRPALKRKHRTLSSVFCLCRGGEDPPMICCDFCDEWYHAACVELSPMDLDRIDAFRCPRCARRQHLYYLDKKLIRREARGRRPALARVETFVAQMQTQLIAYPPGAHELVAYVEAVKRVASDVDAFVRAFSQHDFSPLVLEDPHEHETTVLELMERVTRLEVALESAQTRLGAVHWCIRACALVLGAKNHAPKYPHLAALLEDFTTHEPAFVFPREEYRLMHWTIAERVEKAATWLRAVKQLEVEEWNVEKALRLQREAIELSAFLQLPAMEVQCVNKILTQHKQKERQEQEDEDNDVTRCSTLAWKKPRQWE